MHPVLTSAGQKLVIFEIVAGSGHIGAAVGFGLALTAQVASLSRGCAVLWVREAAALVETGDAYGPGLAAFGLSPDCCIIAEARTHLDGMRAALEGARCTALTAVILETASPVDLTASRRLKLAAEKSGVVIVLIQLSRNLVPNAAQLRWRVNAGPELAKPDGSRHASFRTTVLKHPAGLDGRVYMMEWDHGSRRFAQTISVLMDAISISGLLAA